MSNNTVEDNNATITNLPPPPPLGRPPLRTWELNGDSTMYERTVAAPSDDDLFLMWTLWGTLAAVVAAFVLLEFIAILSNRVARSNPFNIYLLCLMIPDLLFAICCAVSCSANAQQGAYTSSAACQWQAWYVVWCVAANSWLNAVIAHQLHWLLRSSHVRRRYSLPTRPMVLTHAAAVYAWSAFVASWIFIGNKDHYETATTETTYAYPENSNDKAWHVLPHHATAVSGEACIPVATNRSSTLFFYLAFLPCLAAIPLLYAAAICWDVWRRGLLPTVGKRRLLAIYFLRIVAAFCFMWSPFVILVYVLGTAGVNEPWIIWWGGAFGHFQAAVSASLSLFKPDIARAMRQLLCCQCCENDIDDDFVDRAEHERVRDLSSMQRSQQAPTSGATPASSLWEQQMKHSVIPHQNDDNFEFDDEQEQQQPPAPPLEQHQHPSEQDTCSVPLDEEC